MGNSSSGLGTVVVGALVAGAVGFAAGRLTAPRLGCSTATDHTIHVRADASMDCPDASIKPQNTVTWQSPTATTMAITFRIPGVFVVTCPQGTNVCYSDPPTIVWNPGEKERVCEYAGTLTAGTQNKPLNGRIIIIKP